MKRLASSVLVLGFGIATASQSVELVLGHRLPRDAKLVAGTMLLTSPGQVRDVYAVQRDGVDFLVCPDSSRRITHIRTTDPAFRTPEGVHVGSSLKEIRAVSPVGEAYLPGWAYIVHLRSGWSAAFLAEDSVTEIAPWEDSIADFIFKGTPGG